MALAQERTSSTVPSRTVASGVDSHGASKPRPGSAATTPDSKLVRSVAEIREAEDVVRSHLSSARRLLRKLETRGVHTDAGFDSAAELEERILGAVPVVCALWAADEARARPRLRVVGTKRSGDGRARSSRALAAIAQTIDRLRDLEGGIRDAALAARKALATIELCRAYEECGYESYEEFLDRALGPSPILGAALGLVAHEPLPPLSVDSLRVAGSDPMPVDSGADASRASGAAPAPAASSGEDLPATLLAAPGSTPHAEDGPKVPEIAARAAEVRPAKPAAVRAFARIAICVVAGAIGTSAGIWSNSRMSGLDQAEQGERATATRDTGRDPPEHGRTKRERAGATEPARPKLVPTVRAVDKQSPTADRALMTRLTTR